MVTINDFDYKLPKELIAQSAVHPSDSCKLMVVREKIEHKIFTNLIDYLKRGDVLVINQTKVSRAKIIGNKETGGKVEIILTKKVSQYKYECRIKGTKVRSGTKLILKTTTARVLEKIDDLFIIECENEIGDEDLILPTPPYIKKNVPEKDYQTVFSKKNGSLAAPTAGLHFTTDLIKKIERKGVLFAPVTLHIGFGTFLPVRNINTYKTEPELFEVSKESADIINDASRLITVGTTSMKTIESASKNGKVKVMKKYSNIFIKPGYKFNMAIDAMVTNFHLPKSSLLMLVSAFGGIDRLKVAYEQAVNHKYRFYSLGDAMLLYR